MTWLDAGPIWQFFWGGGNKVRLLVPVCSRLTFSAWPPLGQLLSDDEAQRGLHALTEGTLKHILGQLHAENSWNYSRLHDQRLTTVCLDGENLSLAAGGGTIRLVAHFVARSHSLTVLSLVRCNIGAAESRALAPALEGTAALTHLDLSHNRLTRGDELRETSSARSWGAAKYEADASGLLAISEALAGNGTLSRLDLRSTELCFKSDTDAVAAAAAAASARGGAAAPATGGSAGGGSPCCRGAG